MDHDETQVAERAPAPSGSTSLDRAWNAADSQFSDAPVGNAEHPCPMDSSPQTPDNPDCAFLNTKGKNAKMPPEAYNRLRQGPKPTVGPKQDAPGYKWPNGSTEPPAVVQDVDMGDGQKIKLYSPKNKSDQTNLPTTDQAVESLRALPPDERKTVKNVSLSPNPGPNPNASGDGGGGDVDLYKTDGEPTQRNVDYRMTHETGHNYQEKFWHSGDDVKEWGDTARADGRSPSDYADSNSGDDFCEFLNVYNATKGTPCEATAKRMYPHRWAKMEEYQKKG